MNWSLEAIFDSARETEFFEEAFAIAGFNGLDYPEKQELETACKDTPSMELSAGGYAAELWVVTERDAFDLIGLDCVESIDGEKAKALGMTYGEFFGYNRAMRDWLNLLSDEEWLSNRKMMKDGEWIAYLYTEATDFLRDRWFCLMEETRRNG